MTGHARPSRAANWSESFLARWDRMTFRQRYDVNTKANAMTLWLRKRKWQA